MLSELMLLDVGGCDFGEASSFGVRRTRPRERLQLREHRRIQRWGSQQPQGRQQLWGRLQLRERRQIKLWGQQEPW